ncbi:MFS transporter [Cohnella sp. GCM10027633]|uniref:MFS transporter n=1 Tax=unclassified Cohnella TaxID=2636738 RepID=UPI0036367DA5
MVIGSDSERSQAWRLVALNFLVSGPLVFISVYLPLVLQDKSFSMLEIGMTLSAGSLVGFAGQLFWGIASDKYGTIRVITLLVFAGTFILFGGLYAADRFAWVFVFAIGVRFFTTSLLPFSDLWTLNYAERTGRDFGFYRHWGSVGIVLLTLLFGAAATAGELPAVFGTHGAIILLVLWLVAGMRERGRPRMQAAELRRGLALFVAPRMLLFAGAVLLVNIPARAFEGFFSIFIKQQGGSDMTIAIIAIIAPLCEIPFFLYGSRWIRGFGVYPILLVSAALYGAIWALYAWSQSVWMLAVTQVAFGGAHVLFYVAAMFHMRSKVPEAMQSTGQLVLFMLTGTLSGVAGNLWAGHQLLNGNASRMFGISALGTLLALLLLLLLQAFDRNRSNGIQTPHQRSS